MIASENAKWENTILQNLSPGNAVYFLHSFMAMPNNPTMRIADCLYGFNRISAVISRDNVTGCQFHPEKSVKWYKNYSKFFTTFKFAQLMASFLITKIKLILDLCFYAYSDRSNEKLKKSEILLFCHDANRGVNFRGKAYSPLIDSLRDELELWI